MPTGTETKGEWIVRLADGRELKVGGLESLSFEEQEQVVAEYEYIRVIRCKDCFFFTEGRNSSCMRWQTRIEADDYCSRARKRGQNEY